jgi:putative inorganic carbon (HCO3(-)) transporter
MLVLVTTVLQDARQIRWIFRAWVLAAAAAATLGLIQFARKFEEAHQAHQPFYDYYVANRMTGFTNHWMTFSAEMMIALLVTTAMILYGSERRWKTYLVGAALLITGALAGAWTRSMWLGAFCGGVYLIWFRRPWALLALPPVLAMLLWGNPFELRERVLSSFAPHGAMDSNAHRAELREIGWNMIKAHPWLGIGPEQVSRQFQNYLPATESRPHPGEYYGHLENDYIQYAAERGVPTMLALMWMIGWVLRDFVLALRRLPAGREERWILHAAVAAIIAVLVSGWDSWNLNNSPVLAMFLAVLGSGYVVVRQSERFPVAARSLRPNSRESTALHSGTVKLFL